MSDPCQVKHPLSWAILAALQCSTQTLHSQQCQTYSLGLIVHHQLQNRMRLTQGNNMLRYSNSQLLPQNILAQVCIQLVLNSQLSEPVSSNRQGSNAQATCFSKQEAWLLPITQTHQLPVLARVDLERHHHPYSIQMMPNLCLPLLTHHLQQHLPLLHLQPLPHSHTLQTCPNKWPTPHSIAEQ